MPLYAHLQADSPVSFRARVIAANNIMNALFMVVSSMASVLIISLLNRTIPELFLVTAVLSAFVSLLVIRHLRNNAD